MTTDELNHDIVAGVLNGIEFCEHDDPLTQIPPIPCEVCGQQIWLGIITSTCGDSERTVYQAWSEAGGFQRHHCDGSLDPDYEDCPVCFDDDDEDDEVSEFVIRFPVEPPTWTSAPVAR